MLTNDEPVKNLFYQQLENWANEIHHLDLAKRYNIIAEEGYVKLLFREIWKTYITDMITEYGFRQLKSKQTSTKKNTRTEISKI